MTPEQIHAIAIGEFRLETRRRADGESYWTRKTATRKATRVLRVSHGANGTVREVKLVLSSLTANKNEFLAAPLTEERVRRAIAGELGLVHE